MGLRQILPSERCPDQHTYTLLALQRTGEAAIGTYCRNGSVSGAQVLNQGRLSLEVTGGRKLIPTMFNLSVGEEIKCELVRQWFQITDIKSHCFHFININGLLMSVCF